MDEPIYHHHYMEKPSWEQVYCTNTVHVPEETLAILRLERTRFPDENPGGDWQYGNDLACIQALAAFWCDQYDWRQHVVRLNHLTLFIEPFINAKGGLPPGR